jgi:replicative DNA helicase
MRNEQNFTDNVTPPPADRDLEENILGAVLLCSKAFSQIAHLATEELFFYDQTKAIFIACQSLYKQSTPIDVVTIHKELIRTAKVTEAGGMAYVAGITNRVCSDANLGYWTLNLAELYMERELMRIGITMTQRSQDDVFELFTRYEKEIQALYEPFSKSASVSIGQICTEIAKGLNTTKEGLKCGFNRLPELIPTNIYVLAARPGMGKTTLAMNMALNAAAKNIPVGFFSLEMGKDQLIARSVASICTINSYKLVHPHLLTDEEKEQFKAAMRSVYKWPLFINDTGGISIDDLKIEARRMVITDKVQVVFIDYIQLVSGGKKSDKRNESREQEIARICRELKSLAKELNIPIVELAQLSRVNENQKDNRPTLNALRDSGSIEQEADGVFFLYREKYYQKESDNSMTDFIIAKHRFGPLETLTLDFDEKYSKFREI